MTRILYVCVHNAGRSQMAQAFTNHLAKQRGLDVVAESAGTVAGEAINPLAVAVMEEVGVSMAGQHPKPLTQAMADAADRKITMGCGVDADACPARIHFTEDWGLDDPKGRPIEEVRAIRDQIKARVEALLDGLAAPPIACNRRAFDDAQSQRHHELIEGLRAALVGVQELPDGWRLTLPSDPETCARAMELAALERLCCPFWTIRLELAPQSGPLVLSLTGPQGAREILRELLAP